MPDLFAQFKNDAGELDISTFHVALLSLFEHMMNDANITDQNKLQTLATLRAKIDIALKDF